MFCFTKNPLWNWIFIHCDFNSNKTCRYRKLFPKQYYITWHVPSQFLSVVTVTMLSGVFIWIFLFTNNWVMKAWSRDRKSYSNERREELTWFPHWPSWRWTISLITSPATQSQSNESLRPSAGMRGRMNFWWCRDGADTLTSRMLILPIAHPNTRLFWFYNIWCFHSSLSVLSSYRI